MPRGPLTPQSRRRKKAASRLIAELKKQEKREEIDAARKRLEGGGDSEEGLGAEDESKPDDLGDAGDNSGGRRIGRLLPEPSTPAGGTSQAPSDPPGNNNAPPVARSRYRSNDPALKIAGFVTRCVNNIATLIRPLWDKKDEWKVKPVRKSDMEELIVEAMEREKETNPDFNEETFASGFLELKVLAVAAGVYQKKTQEEINAVQKK